MRTGISRLVWALAAYLLLCTAAAVFLVQVTLHPQRRPLPEEANEAMQQAAAQFNAQLADVQIMASDGVPLRAWFIRPQPRFTDAVMLLHGLGDNRLGTIGYARLLLRLGYAVLMPDARAHGASGGTVATYGLVERDDIRRWFEWLDANQRPRCIFGLGESMGAAQLLQSLKVEPNFCAVIAESSFSTFREIAYDRMGQHFHAGPWVGRTVLRPVAEIALAIVQVRYHLNLEQASPEDAIAQTRVPVLLIHGKVDSNIPVRHSRRIKARNPGVELWEVDGADHCGAISVAPAEFERKTVNWFHSNQYPHREIKSPQLASQ